MVTTGNEETLTTTEVLANGFTTEPRVTFQVPELMERVNSIIHEGLNDMWLLLTGEEINDVYRLPERRDGRAIGLLWDGQVHMLASKSSALETLRVLGIEML